MSVTSKIKQVWHYVPKRVAAVTVLTAGVIAAVTIPVASNAWGPTRDTFTIEKPADHIAFDSITNNPNYGDERNFLRVRDSDSKYWVAGSNPTGYGNSGKNGWTDTMNMREGHTYDVKLYVHNNAAANLNLVATNVRAHINLPTKESTFGHQFEINGYLWADNAKPQEIWDNIVLKGDEAFHVKVVSQKYYNNLKTEDKGGFDLPNEVYTAKGAGTGALLGYDQMDGKIPGCFQYSGFVLLKIQPVFQVKPAPSYDVAKTVDKTTANPGDTINYTITVKNTGNINLTNVKVNDQLPAYYSSAKETVTSKNGSTGSIVKGGSITFKQLDVGETATIKISYTIKNKDQLECGTTTIINKVTSSTDQDNTEDNNDNNQTTTTVDKDCTPPPVKKPGYDLVKTVDKTAANPGDILTYTLTAINTGEVDLTNVKISDKLPDNYQSVGETVIADGGYTGSISKDGLLTINKLGVGKSATIAISYKLKGVSSFNCGTTIIKNHASAITDQDKTEDRTDNNDTTTTVNRECQSSYDVAKTVDKTTANPGDTINYTITVKNTGNINLTNVKVNDQLPAYYSSAKETVTSKNGSTGSIVKGGSITFKQLDVGETATIKISYTIKNKDQLECGTTTIINKVTSSTDQDNTEDNNDNNQTTTTVNRECQPGYDVIKTVDKTTANPGDTIKYTITAKNTGNVDLTNVKVTDKLPAVYKKASEKVTAPSAITGSIVKNGEVTIAKLSVGKSATIDITYVIKDAKNLPCGTTTIKNHAEGVTDQDNTEDRTDNNDTTTTVDQICTTSFDLVKTVDKTTAKPGDTLTYTLTFKNTGEKALTGVVIRDVLPDKVTLVKDSLKVEPADTEYTGDLEQGIKIKQVAANDVVSVSFQAIVAEEGKFECGITKITNTGSATTDELDKENGNTEDNKVTTEVNKVCTPVTPPVTPPTTPPATTTDDKAVPESPKVIAQTGAGQAIGSVIAIASLIAAITAYIRSRRYAQGL